VAEDLVEHFEAKQIIEICVTVGLSNVINRFQARFLTDVDRLRADDEAGVEPDQPEASSARRGRA
jgi:hypothetical protein